MFSRFSLLSSTILLVGSVVAQTPNCDYCFSPGIVLTPECAAADTAILEIIARDSSCGRTWDEFCIVEYNDCYNDACGAENQGLIDNIASTGGPEGRGLDRQQILDRCPPDSRIDTSPPTACPPGKGGGGIDYNGGKKGGKKGGYNDYNGKKGGKKGGYNDYNGKKGGYYGGKKTGKKGGYYGGKKNGDCYYGGKKTGKKGGYYDSRNGKKTGKKGGYYGYDSRNGKKTGKKGGYYGYDSRNGNKAAKAAGGRVEPTFGNKAAKAAGGRVEVDFEVETVITVVEETFIGQGFPQ